MPRVLISPHQTGLSGRLYSVMDQDFPVLNNESFGPAKPRVGMRRGMSLGGMDTVRSTGFVDVDCRYATEETFRAEYRSESHDGMAEYRMVEARLMLDVDHVELAYELDSPAGLPVGWRHDLSYENPVGRVLTMGIEDRELRGRARLSLAEIGSFMPGGVEDMKKGMNAGLSISFTHLDPPEVEMREGTFADPDEMVYGRISVFEVSLTPLPRLRSAGIVGMDTSDAPDQEMAVSGGVAQEG